MSHTATKKLKQSIPQQTQKNVFKNNEQNETLEQDQGMLNKSYA